ncbi:MAG: amidohydrolase family protein [Gemmatimonadota bacterium]|nr:amidohydrolase family protein [Gemmatimonadota bacterium]
MTKRYLARWVVPVTQPPIENGCVVEQEGIITYVGGMGDAPPGEDHDLGDSVLLPGIINAHTHLELTSMRGFLEDLCFNDWIDKLRSSRKEALTDEMLLDSARFGIVEGLHAGITTYADTCSTGLVMQAMLEMGVRGIMYQETFGSAPEQCDQSMEVLRAAIDRLSPMQTDLVRLGVSPHAPYTICDSLYSASADLARELGLPMGLHIAESASEQEIVCNASGPFAEEWRLRGLSVVPRARSPVALLEATGCLSSSTLLIHCVQLDGEDIDTIARHGCSVAHCPASNAKFGHGISPVAELIARGVTVGLGSDSVASNNRMDILEEARLAALFQRAVNRSERAFSAQQALEMATIGGARALGIGERVGSLEVGKDADLSAFSLSAARATPVGNIIAAILFAVAGTPAHFVAVKGEPRLVDGQLAAPDAALVHRVVASANALGAWERTGTWRPATASGI